MVIIESQTNFQTQPNRNLVGTPRLPSVFWSGDDARDQWKDSECRGWSRKGEVFVGPPEAGRFSGCSPDHVGSPTINHPSWPCGATVRRKKGWWSPNGAAHIIHPQDYYWIQPQERQRDRCQQQDSQHWRVVCVVYSLLCVAVLFGIGQLAFGRLNICSFSLQHCAALRTAAAAIEDRLVK